MATTPNFNWATPDNTGLVKNGALDIRTLGDAIDASLVDLKGGTTNQVLAKNSNTDMDFKWVADASGGGMTLISTTTLSGTNTDITVTSGYVQIYAEITGVTANTSDGYLQIYPNATFSIGQTVTMKRAAGSNSFDDGVELGAPNLVTRTDANNAWGLLISNVDSTTRYKPVQFWGTYNTNAVRMLSVGTISTNSAITSLRFTNAAGGTWAGGTVKLYGVK